jgi:ornithine carbamoyltransferase
MTPGHFVTLKDYKRPDVEAVFELTRRVKAEPQRYADALSGRSLAFVFQRPAPFARLSFELATAQLGAVSVDFGAEGFRFDQPGSVAHAGRLLSRYVDAIVARLESHKDLVELARLGTVPVINVRSDLLNPCQALTDYFTLLEKRGRLEGLQVAYVGAGTDVCHALLMGAVTLGLSIAIVTPPGREPNTLILKSARREAERAGTPQPVVTSDVLAAVAGADVVYTDAWSAASGAESRADHKAFAGYSVTTDVMRVADANAVFMHALSAPWGGEVAREVVEGPQSAVLDQAENRRHVQKALLLSLLGKAGA